MKSPPRSARLGHTLHLTSSAAATATNTDIGLPGDVSRVSSVAAGHSSSAFHLLSQASSWLVAAAAANIGSSSLDMKRSTEYNYLFMASLIFSLIVISLFPLRFHVIEFS
ncbi:hypothetical protein PIB30_041438 [Stylosanthes scabra]|uniref:Uncharacterized protein n=1 Tax=Stylosanthes scabra TaxID=79078 RepID=A0ABU6XF72_9FABA|nr:hypothetical protein [Stylosanthes scabra]